jgi:16S rRNA G966 N2-methylase RsmD
MAANLGVQDSVSILELDALTAVRTLARRKEKFNIVFLDPPYESDWISRLAACPDLWKLPKPGGLIVAERQADGRDLPVPQDLLKRLSRRYGGTLVEVYETIISE